MDSFPAPDDTLSDPAHREWTLGHLSLVFLLDQVAAGVAGLSARDALLVMAINQANIAPLTREPQARDEYGGLESPAPDAERRPVSISAIAGSLGLPFETVRRRIRTLETLGVCVASDHGVIVPETFLASPAYLQSVVMAHERLRVFYWQLRGARLVVVESLPVSAFDVGDVVPVRAAARLLSDYILRASDGLKAEAGDVVSTLVLIGVLCASTAPNPRPVSMAALSQRLQLPDETVRRHANRLVESGLCARTPRGLVVTPEILGRPIATALFRQNAANLQRLFTGLAERGVVEVWERQGPPTGRIDGRPS